jgi:hypothetical protein
MASAVPSREELEKNIEELTIEYNANVEKLLQLEVELNDSKDRRHSAIKSLYENKKFSFSRDENFSNLEKEYAEVSELVVVQQQDCFKKQSQCFKQLQNLRQLQHTYLVGIINGLQKELSAAKAPQDVEDLTSKAVRQNNI